MAVTGFWAGAIRADGLIYGPDFSPAEPDEAATIANAQAALGGENWAGYLFSQEEAETILNALPGRSWLIGGEITSREAPTLTLSAALIDTLQHQTVTASVDVHATDANEITARVFYPSGRVSVETMALSQGLAEFEISTSENGSHAVEILSIETGSAKAEFEAVEMRPVPEVQAQLDNYHRGFILRRTPKPSLLTERITPLWQQI